MQAQPESDIAWCSPCTGKIIKFDGVSNGKHNFAGCLGKVEGCHAQILPS